MRTPLPDSAVSDHFARSRHALAVVQRLQRIRRFERPIFIRRLRPRNIRRSGNVPGALRRFRHARRRDNFPGELIRRPHVHQLRRPPLFHRRKNFFLARANALIRLGRVILRPRHLRRLRRQRTLLFQPLLPPAVNQPDILVPVIFQLPQSVRREPVVVVAVKQNGRVVRNSRRAQQRLQRLLIDQIPPHIILQLRLPVPAHRARDVSLVVGRGVHVHFHQTNLRIVQMLRRPLRRYQYFRMLVLCHVLPPRIRIS